MLKRKPRDALFLYRKEYGRVLKRYGPEDPATLDWEQRMACEIGEKGSPQEAASLLRHVLQGRTTALGLHDPKTLVTMSWLAHFEEKLGNLNDAQELWEGAVAAYTSQGLAESRRALVDTKNLGNLYGRMDRLQQAREVHQFVVDASRRSLGEDDPVTLNALHHLANVQAVMGDFASAKGTATESLQRQERTLGDTNERTVRARELLSRIDRHIGGS